MAIRDSRKGESFDPLQGFDLDGTTNGDEAASDSTNQSLRSTDEILEDLASTSPFTPTQVYNPLRNLTPGIYRDTPEHRKALDDEQWRKDFAALEAQLFQQQLDEAVSAQGPQEFTTPTDTPGVSLTQEAVTGVEPPEDALQPPDTTPLDQQVRDFDESLRANRRIANASAFEAGGEAVDRAFGDLPDKVRLTQASDEFFDQNRAEAINRIENPEGDPVKEINDALDRGLIAVDEAFAARQRQLAEDVNPWTAPFLSAGKGALALAGSLAEIGAQYNPDPAQRALAAKTSDFFRELSQGAVTSSATSLDFREGMQEKVEKDRAEGAGLFEAFGNVTGLFGGREGGKVVDRFLDEWQAFSKEAAEDPSGAVAFGTEAVGNALPSLYLMLVGGTIFKAGNPKITQWLLGSALETGAQLDDAAHDEATGERRQVEVVDHALALTSGLAAGYFESLGANKVLEGMNRMTRTSKGFRRLPASKQRQFYRELGQSIKELGTEAFQEGGTEVLQGLVTDAAAKVGWDPEREIGEGSVENFIGGFGAGGLMPVPRQIGLIRQGVRQAGYRAQAEENAAAFAETPNEALMFGAVARQVNPDVTVPDVPAASTSAELALEVERRSIELTPDQILENPTQKVLDEYEARGLPAEHNILFVSDNDGNPIHTFHGRDNIQKYLDTVHREGKEAAFQEKSVEDITPETEEGPTQVTEDAAPEEGVAEVTDRIRSAVVTIPQEGGGVLEFDGATHAFALQEAADAGVIEVNEQGDPIIPDGANVDLFRTEQGDLINRVEAKERFGFGAAENLVVDSEAEVEAEARIRAEQQVKPKEVLEPAEIEALETELEQIEEELGGLEYLEGEEGDLTDAQQDRKSELEDRQSEIISQIPVAPMSDEEYLAEMQRFADLEKAQPQMSIRGLKKLFMGDMGMWKVEDLERMLELNKESNILNKKSIRAIARYIGEVKQAAAPREVEVVEEAPVEPPPVIEETAAQKEQRRTAELVEDLTNVRRFEMPNFREGEPILLDERTFDLLLAWATIKASDGDTRIARRRLNRAFQEWEVKRLDDILESDRPIFPATVGDEARLDVRTVNRIAAEIVADPNIDYRPFHGIFEDYPVPADLERILERAVARGLEPEFVEQFDAAIAGNETFFVERHNELQDLIARARAEAEGGRLAPEMQGNSTVEWSRSGIGASEAQMNPETRYTAIMGAPTYLEATPERTDTEDVDDFLSDAHTAGQEFAPPTLTLRLVDDKWHVFNWDGRNRAALADRSRPIQRVDGIEIPVDFLFEDADANPIKIDDLTDADFVRPVVAENGSMEFVLPNAEVEVTSTEPPAVIVEPQFDLFNQIEEVQKPVGASHGTATSENVDAVIAPQPEIAAWSREELQEEVEKASRRLNLPAAVSRVIVVQSAQDLVSEGLSQEAADSAAGDNGLGIGAGALYWVPNGNVYVIADNIPATEPLADSIDRLIIHELVVHGGFRTMFGEQFDEEMGKLWDSFFNREALRPVLEKYLDELRDENGEALPLTEDSIQGIIVDAIELNDVSKSILMEEYAAFVSESLMNDIRIEAFTGKPDSAIRKFWNQFLEALRRLFRTNGYRGRFQEEVLRELIMRSAANLRVRTGRATEQDLQNLNSAWAIANERDGELYSRLREVVSKWDVQQIAAFVGDGVLPTEILEILQEVGFHMEPTVQHMIGTIGQAQIAGRMMQRRTDKDRRARYNSGSPSEYFSRVAPAKIAGIPLMNHAHNAQTLWKVLGTRSPYFKNWFGDWETAPASASKVVNEDGSPKAIFHGTRNKFYTFDTELGTTGLYGKGAYFTDNLAEAESYAGKRFDDSYERPFVNPVTQEEIDQILPQLREAASQATLEGLDEIESAWALARMREAINVSAVSPRFLNQLIGFDTETGKFLRGVVEDLIGRKLERPQAKYRVVKAYLNMRSPLDLTGTLESFEPVFRRVIAELGGSIQKWNQEVSFHRQWFTSPAEQNVTSPIDWAAAAVMAGQRFNSRFSQLRGRAPGRTDAMRMIVSKLKTAGYDGIVTRAPFNTTHWVAWDAEQIKLTDNLGTFGPQNRDARFARATAETDYNVPTFDIERLIDRYEARIQGLELERATNDRLSPAEARELVRQVERLRVEQQKLASVLRAPETFEAESDLDNADLATEDGYTNRLMAAINGTGVSELDIQAGLAVFNSGHRDLAAFVANSPKFLTDPEKVYGAVLTASLRMNSMGQLDDSARKDYRDFNTYQGTRVDTEQSETVTELPANLRWSDKAVKISADLRKMDRTRIDARIRDKILKVVNDYGAEGWLPVEEWSIKEIRVSFTQGGKNRIQKYGDSVRNMLARIPNFDPDQLRGTLDVTPEAMDFYEQVVNEAIAGRDEFFFTEAEQELLREVYSELVIPTELPDKRGRLKPTSKVARESWAKVKKAVFEPSVSVTIDWTERPYTYQILDNRPDVPEKAAGNSQIRSDAWADQIASKMAREVGTLVDRALTGKDPVASNILRQRMWYTNIRAVLRHRFGTHGELFADLLGATSARQAVDINWRHAVEAMDLFMQGKYERELDIYERYLVWNEMYKERGKLKKSLEKKSLTEDARAGINQQIEDIDNRMTNYLAENPDVRTGKFGRYAGPLATNAEGAQFGINSEAVMRALVNVYRIVRQGQTPKTRNFTGNLIGYSDEATIDVWAARLIQRLAGDPRVPPAMEGSVQGTIGASMKPTGQFAFGQKVFNLAMEKLNSGAFGSIREYLAEEGSVDFINATHELQALMWFAEKEIWSQNGWTNAAGEGGSYETSEINTQSDRFGIIATDMDAIAAALVDDDTPRTALSTAPILALENGEITETGFVEVLATTDVDPAELAVAVLDRATEIEEPNIVLVRTFGRAEINDNARPGAQIAFKEAVPFEQAEGLLRWMKGQGVTNASLMVGPQRSRDGQPLAFGIRILSTPELDMVNDPKLARQIAEKGSDFYFRKQRDLISRIMEQAADQAERSNINVSMMLYENSDILVINEKDYGTERARFANLLTNQRGERNARDVGETELVGTWGVTRSTSVERWADEWSGQDGQSLRRETATQEITRRIRDRLKRSDFGSKVIAARGIFRLLGVQATDVEKSQRMWDLNVPAYLEQYASIWPNILEADIIPRPTRRKGEDDFAYHRRQYDRALQEIEQQVGRGITFDPANDQPGSVYVQVPYSPQIPIDALVEYAFIESNRVVAERDANPASSPIIIADQAIRGLRNNMEKIGVKLTNREFARFYQLEMGRALMSALGLTDMVLSRLGVAGRVRSTEAVMNKAQELWDELRPRAEQDVSVRFARRTPPAKVEWLDAVGRERRTLRNLTLSEVQGHSAYNPENAERTQVTNTQRTYVRLAEQYLEEGDTVLDFGGGLGVGTEALREMGFEADLYEPFSNPERRRVAPDFVRLDAKDVPTGYDKILSTFVLNVVPQDIRDNIIERIGAKLKVGGEAIITARPWSSVRDTLKTEGTIDLGNRQVLTTRGTYQRGYQNSNELAQEVEDVLGTENFIVQSEPKGPAVRVMKLSEPSVKTTDARYSRNIDWAKLNAAERNAQLKDGVDEVLRILGGDETRLPIGDPRLSGFGTRGMNRLALAESDEVREAMGFPTRHDFKKAKEEAVRILQDPVEKQKVKERLLGNVPPQDEVSAYVAQILVDQEWTDALQSGDRAKIEEAMILTLALRENRANVARALAAGRDEFKTPAERHQDAIKRIIFTYPPYEREVLLLKELRRKGKGTSKTATAAEKRLKKAMELQQKRIQKFIEFLTVRGYDITNLPESLLEDEIRVAKLIKEMAMMDDTAGKSDKMYEWWVNSILSAPTTQMANFLGNSTNIMLEYAFTRNVQGLLNEVRNVFGAELTADDPRLREVADIMGFYGKRPRILANAITTAWRNASIAFDREMPYVEGKVLGELGALQKRVAKDKFDLSVGRRRAIGGKFGRFVRLPGRLLIFWDELFRSLIIDAEKVAVASRLASLKKLKGEARNQFVELSVFDPSSEAAMVVREKATETATELLFQKQVAPLLNKLLLETRSIPWAGKLVAYIVPFVTAPTNIIRKALKFTPLVMGGVMLARTGAHIGGKFGAGAYVYEASDVVDNIAHLSIGGLFTLLAMMMVGVGRDEDDDRMPIITGSQTHLEKGEWGKKPQFDHEQRKSVPPRSIRLGSQWIDYSRIEPFGTAVAMVVDSVIAARNIFSKDRDVMSEIGDLGERLQNTVTDQSFLQGTYQMMEAMRDGQAFMYWASNFTSSWIPNVTRSAIRAVDPTLIDVRLKGEGVDETLGSFLERVVRQGAMPIAAAGATIKYDMYGRPLIRDEGVPVSKLPATDWAWRFAMPIKTFDTARAHPADIMIWKYNQNADDPIWPEMPKSRVRIEGIDYRIGDNLPVYNEWARRSGRLADAEIRIAIASGEFNIHNPAKEDMERLRNIFRTTRQEAMQTMLADGTLNPLDSPSYRKAYAEEMGLDPDVFEERLKGKEIISRDFARNRIK